MQSTENKIKEWVIKQRRGKIFFTNDLQNFGSSGAVRLSLFRLCKEGFLTRLSAGIFVYPKYSKFLGEYINPSIEEIAKAIAKNEKIRIIPTGLYALNVLGLSTQVPMRVVFLTDGTPRAIKLKGEVAIILKKTIPKYLSFKSEITTLVIFALKEIGNGKVLDSELQRIKEVLSHEKPEIIKHDAALAPQWITETLLKLIENG
ncbi:hypothetical protein FACS1894201_11860 [Bacteroidia bacterium]|nr:hypothetical protein FACS1894201_11860 [Bacteroidia bacterium]